MKNTALVLAVLLLSSLGALALFLPMGSLTAAVDEGSASELLASESASEAVDRPVVLELFTSQGCSSCPPADRILRDLGERDDVLALSFHVDYWNYIGWTDPFSSKRWSKRQESYARVLEGGRLYTPQLVVDRRAHVVGSDARGVARLIQEARARASLGEVTLEASWRESEETLQVLASASKQDSAPKLDLWLAVVESELETPISRGENGGQTLENDFVVRRLQKLFTLRKDAVTHRAQVEIEEDWQRENLSLVAFLQSSDDLAIYGAARSRP